MTLNAKIRKDRIFMCLSVDSPISGHSSVFCCNTECQSCISNENQSMYCMYKSMYVLKLK